MWIDQEQSRHHAKFYRAGEHYWYWPNVTIWLHWPMMNLKLKLDLWAWDLNFDHSFRIKTRARSRSEHVFISKYDTSVISYELDTHVNAKRSVWVLRLTLRHWGLERTVTLSLWGHITTRWVSLMLSHETVYWTLHVDVTTQNPLRQHLPESISLFPWWAVHLLLL